MTGDVGDAGSTGVTRRRQYLGVLLIAGLLVAGHLQITAAQRGATGLLLVVDHVYQAALAMGVLLTAFAVGDRLLVLTGFADPGCLDRLLTGTVLGTGAFALAFLGLSGAGALSLPTLLGVPLAAVIWARRELSGVLDVLSEVAGDLPRPVLVVAGVMGAALLLRGIAPPTDWDSLMYHLHLPEQFLEEGRIFLPDDTLHVAFVGLAHMLYVPLLELGGTSAPVLLSLTFGLLLPLSVCSLARRMVGPIASEVAGVAVWGTTTIALVAVTARVDVTLLLFLTVGHLALYEALAGEGGRRWLMLAAVLLGLSVGVKYQAGGYVLALTPLVAWSAVNGGGGDGVGWRDFAWFGAVVAVVATPWLVKNWFLLDAPFYPFLADRQLPRWLAELHGGRGVPEAVDAAVFGALAEVRRPFDLIGAFLDPGRMSPEAEAAHYRLSPLLLLLPAWVAWLRDRDLAWLLVPGLGYVALVLAISPRTNLRYLLPAVPPLTVAASALAVRILDWGMGHFGPGGGRRGEGEDDPDTAKRRQRRVRIAATALAVVSVVPTGISLHQWLPGEVSLSHLSGAESRRAYLSERRDPALVAHAGLTDFGERAPPEDARVLMMFEARELYFTVPAYQDPLLTNWSLLAPISAELDCLRSTDITHVLVGTGVLGYYFDRGLDPETVRWPQFLEFADRCLERELEVPGHVLYRVPPADGEDVSDEAESGEGPEPP